MTDDLVAFLRLRLDEDETAARAVIGGRPFEHGRYLAWFQTMDGIVGDRNGTVVAYSVKPWAIGHVVRHDPARVLREVEAKRKIVGAAVVAWNETCNPVDEFWVGIEPMMRAILRQLAQVYADHEDYREEWRP